MIPGVLEPDKVNLLDRVVGSVDVRVLQMKFAPPSLALESVRLLLPRVNPRQGGSNQS